MTPFYHPAQPIPHASGIYRITCTVTGKFYIGSAIDLQRRWRTHLHDFRHKKHRNSKLQRAWNKYGEEAFTFEPIEFVLVPFLLEREQYWFDKLQPFSDHGFNIAPNAGSTIGRSLSLETREKLRQVNLGKTQSEESKEKCSKALKGRKKSPEHIENTRIARGYAPIGVIRDRINSVVVQDPHVTLVAIDPNGIEYYVSNIRKFCRDHDLDRSTFMRVAKGQVSQHKGWIALFN